MSNLGESLFVDVALETDRTPTQVTTVPSSALTALTALTALAALTACARMAPPPGGPPDTKPPRLLGTIPESLMILRDYDGNVDFLFDEVISEGGSPSEGTGTSDLEQAIILSPTTNVPVVKWKRNRLSVHPKEDWWPNRVYRVEMLPGLYDLQHNRIDTGAVLTFTTGAPLPTATLTGQVIDWLSQKPAPQAVIEAVLLPDSLPYRMVADSSGRFTLGPIPKAEYLVYASVDQDRNRRHDGREAFDSVLVPPDSMRVPELWVFVHDTIGPRIQAVTVSDSLAALVQFTLPLDPQQTVDTSSVRLLALPDSTPVAIRSILTQRVDDSLHAPVRTPSDSGMRVDSVALKQKPTPFRPPPLPVLPPTKVDTSGLGALLQQRPPLSDKLVLRVESNFVPGTRYFLQFMGIRNANGVAADPSSGFTVPEKPAVPALPDTLHPAVPADSTRADTLQRPAPR